MLNNITPNAVLRYLVIIIIGLLVVLGLEFFFVKYYFPLLTIILLLFVIVVMCFLIYRKLIINFQDNRNETRGSNQQLDPLFFLHKKINFRKPLPPLRGYAASPDFLALMTEIVLSEKPKTIVEAGSGVSTIINGYLLEQLGEGKVFALDHEKEFGNKTQENLRKHIVGKHAEVIIAPLKSHLIENKSWQWYATDDIFQKIKKIDLLIIDGPPQKIQRHARYPALSLLFNLLSDNATILIDDAARVDDRLVVEMWLNEFPNLSKEYFDLEKGAIVLKVNK